MFIKNCFSPLDRVTADYSDEDEDFSSGNDEVEVEGSDSEPMADDRRRGRKSKINGNVRVSYFILSRN